jgi:glycosyltransferase involved in cell wall biosynthesis
VITDLDVGGAERALVALATHLDRGRWQPTVIALGPEAKLAGPLRDAGISTICLDVNRRRPWQAVHRLAEALRQTRPALVQSFLFHANFAARLAAKQGGRPVVVSGLRVAEREKRWHLWLDRITAAMSSATVCVSTGVKRHAIRNRLGPAERFVVIPNGIDASYFDHVSPNPRSSLSVAEDAFVALFVGRIEKQKGVNDLLRAVEVVVREKNNFHLVVVGDGPLRSALERESAVGPFAEESGLPRSEGQDFQPVASAEMENDIALGRQAGKPVLRGHVHWLGRRDDVPGLLKMCDVLVLPSLWEGMPNVVLEAMASRRAVVATAVEGSEDLVVPGQTGWLVPPSDPEALANALIDAMSDRQRLRDFGESGRSRAEAKFSQLAVVSDYQRLWARLLGFTENGVEPDEGQ